LPVGSGNSDALSMNWCSKCESRSCNLQILRLIRQHSHPVYSLMRKVLLHLGGLLVTRFLFFFELIATRRKHRARPNTSTIIIILVSKE
jgi:uncharacterized protein YggT (Ycf19 family)